MLQLIAVVLCAWCGWRRDPFLRWPLGIISVAVIAGAALIIGGQGSAGLERDQMLLRYTVSLIVLPLLAYWLAWFMRSWRERREG